MYHRLLWDVHTACYHRLCFLKVRLRSFGQFRMRVLRAKPITWKEHYLFGHTLKAVVQKGSVLRGMEESVERNIGIVKKEDAYSRAIVEPSKRSANTLLRSALRGQASKPNAVVIGRQCKACGGYVSKKKTPSCTCS